MPMARPVEDAATDANALNNFMDPFRRRPAQVKVLAADNARTL